MADRAPSHDLTAVLTGAAAVHRALDTIGSPEGNDRDLAKHIVDGELGIRALLRFAIAKLAEDLGGRDG